MVLVDSITRLLPGVLGCGDSAVNDTFSRGLLKNPQYTRPRIFEGTSVPEVLLSGDHAVIAEWRFVASVQQTLERRPELLDSVEFSDQELRVLKKHSLLEVVQKIKTGSVSDR
jgi:tRNA (guanine37-N1)-methyltransferase